MPDVTPAYGLWSLVAVNSAIFIFFAFTFFKPRTRRDWRSFGTFSGFLVALFAEMYGFPLTIYLLSGWLQRRHRPSTGSLTMLATCWRCYSAGRRIHIPALSTS